MKNFAGVSLPIAVAIVLGALPGALINSVYRLMASLVAEYVDPSFLGVLGGLVQGTSSLVGLIVNSYILGGVLSFALKVARGQPVAFGDVFSGGRYFGRMLVAQICAAIAVGLGFALCAVPGFIVLYGICLYGFLIVDQDMAGVDALKKSWEMTKGHRLNIFVLHLLALVVVIAGALACGIGVLLGSIPILVIAGAFMYLRIKGEQPRLQGS